MYQIFVVEDELLIRQSIRNMIENMGGPYVFCGEAADGEMALSMMQDLMPDILLTDIRMPFLDGLELIRHAKAMMPWLRILIISGYDEFESAQKAISLGVDRYLLKPLRSEELVAAIKEVAEQLEKSKTHSVLLAEYDKQEVHQALTQQFMQQLFLGGAGTSQLLERARLLELELVHPLYQVVLFHFDAGTAGLHAQVAELFSENHTALPYFSGTDQMALLVTAQKREALSEKVYRLVSIVLHQLKGSRLVTTVIGNIVQRLSAVKDAYGTADTMLKKIRTVSAGQVIDINDTAQITAGIVSFSSTFEAQYRERLLYASVQEVPGLLAEFLAGAGGDQFNSMLYRYYTLIDILKTAVQVVAAAKPELEQKDIAAQFSSAYDIFAASNQRDSFEKLAGELLAEAVRMKQENPSFIRHSHVISKAEQYIAENFCDPNISLIVVARHVGLSAAHFSTVFSQTTSRTFISYLTAMRIEKAKELLAHSDQKLAAIAMEIGYNEPNYFSHVFKKNEGLTPKEYRGRFQPK